MEITKNVKMAVSLEPAEWAQSYISEVPDLQSRLVEAGDSFQKHVLKGSWEEWSLLPVAGWYAIASELFDFKKRDGVMDAEEFTTLNMFMAAMSWSYKQKTYVIHTSIGENNTNKQSVLNLPSKSLINLTHNHKYGFYISLDTEVLDNNGASVKKERATDDDLNAVTGLMVVMTDEVTPDTTTSQPHFTLVILSDRGVSAITLRVGDWSIKEALVRYIMEDDETGKLTKAEAAIQAENLAPILNVVMFFCTDQANFIKAQDIESKSKPGEYGDINPDIQFLSLDSVLGEQNREWLAVEADGLIDVQLAAIN